MFQAVTHRILLDKLLLSDTKEDLATVDAQIGQDNINAAMRQKKIKRRFIYSSPQKTTATWTVEDGGRGGEVGVF